MTEGSESYGVGWKLSLSCMRISLQVPKADEWSSPVSSRDLKGDFQTPETTRDLLRVTSPPFPCIMRCFGVGVQLMLPADESLDPTLQTRCDGVCAGTPSQLTWLNPVCFGSSAPAAGARGSERSLDTQKVTGGGRAAGARKDLKTGGKKKRKKKKETIASINFWWQFFVFSN